ncbi:hypothetical protein GCM10020367_42900 [Streptomyces sannanensis]|uniref:Uncharacterized protein n=1 Tax=Streptomyces sannanensis TaxID=285536 RepID=A0ABP6SFX7_9ACTN
MTVMTERPHMTTEEFEHLARIAARETEGLRLEFGKEVTLPDPVGITLQTEPLKDWVR